MCRIGTNQNTLDPTEFQQSNVRRPSKDANEKYDAFMEDAKKRWGNTQVTVSDDGKLSAGKSIGTRVARVILFPWIIARLITKCWDATAQKNDKVVQQYQKQLESKYGKAGGAAAFGALPDNVKRGIDRLTYKDVIDVSAQGANWQQTEFLHQQDVKRREDNQAVLNNFFGNVAPSRSGDNITKIQPLGLTDAANSKMREIATGLADKNGVTPKEMQYVFENMSKKQKLDILGKAALPVYQKMDSPDTTLRQADIDENLAKAMDEFLGKQESQADKFVSSIRPEQQNQKSAPPDLSPGVALLSVKFLEKNGRSIIQGPGNNNPFFAPNFKRLQQLAIASGDQNLRNEVNCLKRNHELVSERSPMYSQQIDVSNAPNSQTAPKFLNSLNKLYEWNSKNLNTKFQPARMPSPPSNHPLGGVVDGLNSTLLEMGDKKVESDYQSIRKSINTGRENLMKGISSFAATPENRKLFVDNIDSIRTHVGVGGSVSDQKGIDALGRSLAIQGEPRFQEVMNLDKPPEKLSEQEYQQASRMIASRNELKSLANDNNLDEYLRAEVENQIYALDTAIKKLGGEDMIQTAQLKHLRTGQRLSKQEESDLNKMLDEQFKKTMADQGIEDPDNQMPEIQSKFVERKNVNKKTDRVFTQLGSTRIENNDDQWEQNKLASLERIQQGIKTRNAIPEEMDPAIKDLYNNKTSSPNNALLFLSKSADRKQELSQEIDSLNFEYNEEAFKTGLGSAGQETYNDLVSGLGTQRTEINQVEFGIIKADRTKHPVHVDALRYEGYSSGFRGNTPETERGVRMDGTQIRGVGKARSADGSHGRDMLVLHDPNAPLDKAWISTGVSRDEVKQMDADTARKILTAALPNKGLDIVGLDEETRIALATVAMQNSIDHDQLGALVDLSKDKILGNTVKQGIRKLPELFEKNDSMIGRLSVDGMLDTRSPNELQKHVNIIDQFIQNPRPKIG